MDKTLAYVNLGLELRSGGAVERALPVLRENFLEHLFRLAQAEVARARGRLRAAVQSGRLKQCPGGVKSLDGEWYEGAEELLAATPKISRSREQQIVSTYDFFRIPADLQRASHFVDVVLAAADLYVLLSGRTEEPGREFSAEKRRGGEDPTAGALVMTAAANLLISGQWSTQALPQASWPETFPAVQPGAIRGAVTRWVERSVSGEKRKALVKTYLDPILRDYEMEMRAFSLEDPPDAQLVRFFVFRES